MIPRRNRPRFDSRDSVSLAELRRIEREAARSGNTFSTAGGATMSEDGGLSVSGPPDTGFWAKITTAGPGTGNYSFVELAGDPGVTVPPSFTPVMLQPPGAIKGDVLQATDMAWASEVNGNTAVPVNTVVRLFYSEGGGFYYFDHPAAAGGGAPTVETTNPGTGDSTVSIAGCNDIKIDQGSGLKLANPSGVIGTISAQNASTTHAGVVSVGVQTVVGPKTVRTGVYPLSVDDGVVTNSLGLAAGALPGPGAAGGADRQSCIANGNQTINAGGTGGVDMLFTQTTNLFSVAACASSTGTAAFAIRTAAGARTLGISVTVGYNKSAGGTGTLVFTGGILTSST